MLHSIQEILVESELCSKGLLRLADMFLDSRASERNGVQVIMPVLLAFYVQGGLDILKTMLLAFLKDLGNDPPGSAELPRTKVASYGLKKILELYSWFINGKTINDSTSQYSLLPRTQERRPETPIQQQLTLEFRAAILPVVREIWDSKMLEEANDLILRGVVELLKSISVGDFEPNGHQRTDLVSWLIRIPVLIS